MMEYDEKGNTVQSWIESIKPSHLPKIVNNGLRNYEKVMISAKNEDGES